MVDDEGIIVVNSGEPRRGLGKLEEEKRKEVMSDLYK